MKRTDTNDDATWDHEFFYATDAQFSTLALMVDDGSGFYIPHERARYTPYGDSRHSWGNDVDGDGDADTTDSGIISGITSGTTIGSAGYRSEADLDRDGVIDGDDTTMWNSMGGSQSALAEGMISDANDPYAGSPENAAGYAGYLFNPDEKTYHVRYRTYLPESKRWLQRDPLGYVDGTDVYGFVGANPITQQDSMGLEINDGGVVEIYFGVSQIQTQAIINVHSAAQGEKGLIQLGGVGEFVLGPPWRMNKNADGIYHTHELDFFEATCEESCNNGQQVPRLVFDYDYTIYHFKRQGNDAFYWSTFDTEDNNLAGMNWLERRNWVRGHEELHILAWQAGLAELQREVNPLHGEDSFPDLLECIKYATLLTETVQKYIGGAINDHSSQFDENYSKFGPGTYHLGKALVPIQVPPLPGAPE